MKRLASVTLLVCLAMSVGCATVPMSKKGMKVEEATVERVKGCEFVGDVRSASGWGGGAMTGVAFRNTLNDAMNKAGNLGATHIVFDGKLQDPSLVRGKAYRCPASEAAK